MGERCRSRSLRSCGRRLPRLDYAQARDHFEVPHIPGDDPVVKVESGHADLKIREGEDQTVLSCLGVDLRHQLAHLFRKRLDRDSCEHCVKIPPSAFRDLRCGIARIHAPVR